MLRKTSKSGREIPQHKDEEIMDSMMDALNERFKIFSIVQIVSASISILGSLMLLFMIFRSHDKLRSTLHRLLFGLTISDLISSIAMAFASTLSPPEHIGWNSFGNMTLCRIQGFLHFYGHIAAPLYNCSLCIYYLIEIKYTSLNSHIKGIEILMHLGPTMIALTFTTAIVSIYGVHPEVTNCYAGATYPFECKFNPEIECSGDMKGRTALTITYLLLLYAFVPVTIFTSMTAIYREVATQEVRMNQFRYSFSRRGSHSAQRNTVAARNRATAYSIAWLLTWGMMFLITLMIMITGEEAGGTPFFMALMHYILFPLQGLFNFIVYIYPRLTARMRRQDRQEVSLPCRFWLSLKDVVMSRGRQERTRARRQTGGGSTPRSERGSLRMTSRGNTSTNNHHQTSIPVENGDVCLINAENSYQESEMSSILLANTDSANNRTEINANYNHHQLSRLVENGDNSSENAENSYHEAEKTTILYSKTDSASNRTGICEGIVEPLAIEGEDEEQNESNKNDDATFSKCPSNSSVYHNDSL